MASKKEGGVLSKVPLPDTFFSIKHQLRPIASLSVSAPSAILIYLVTIGGFVGCWLFYSLPNHPVTVTVIQSEWQKEGYECTPLQKEPKYGLLYNYDECTREVKFLDDSSLVLTNTMVSFATGGSSGGEKYSYKPFTASGTYYVFDTTKTYTLTFAQQNLFKVAITGEVFCASAPGMTPDKNLCKGLFESLVAFQQPCNLFKENSPFQCTKTEVTYKSGLEKLSLSIANTQLLFGVLTAFFAFMFYKCKKIPTIAPDGQDWQEAIRQLQEALTKKVDKSDKEMV